MKLSKSKIDRAGQGLAKESYRDADEWVEYEDVLDEFRKAHLQPLTETTLELQRWLTGYESDYYIAQRLKRKPQIIRKLGRLSVRLTQLQDIGGCRIIVEKTQMLIDCLALLKSALRNSRVSPLRELLTIVIVVETLLVIVHYISCLPGIVTN